MNLSRSPALVRDLSAFKAEAERLASTHGPAVAVVPDAQGRLVMIEALPAPPSLDVPPAHEPYALR